MELTSNSRRMITRYLLGELTEAERAALEEQYFTDQKVFEQVVQTENELVDNYVRDRLAEPERTRFEQYYLSHPARRERMRFSKALITKLDQAQKANHAAGKASGAAESWWHRLVAALRSPGLSLSYSMALAAVLIVVGGAWLLLETRHLRQQLTEARGAQMNQAQRERELEQKINDERQRADQLAVELERLRTQTQTTSPEQNSTGNAVPALISLVLSSDGMRGGSADKPLTLIITPGTKRVRLLFNAEAQGYASYRMGLRPVGGEEVWSRQGLTPKPSSAGASFTTIVPADKFATGDYILTLSGASETGEFVDVNKYFFRVSKK